MGIIFLNGFLTGLLLQIAIGPVFFFILNIALQRTVIDGLSAVLAVTLVDYLFITLAVLGVGKLLEKPKIKTVLGVVSSIVLVGFGIAMVLMIKQTALGNSTATTPESGYLTSFMSAFALTISSPLTIVFWTSLFAAKAIEKGYQKKELVLFGIAAGFATCVFLGFSVALFATIKASVPVMLLRTANTAVGTLLIGYGIVRLFKITGFILPFRAERSG